MTAPIEIDTPRLRLRGWLDADREPWAAMNADPRVMRHFPSLLTRAQTDAMVDRIRVAFAERGWGLWAAERRDTGAFIGFIGLTPVPAALPLPPGVEIGWRLAAAHWKQGFATEGASAALRIAFERLRLPEVVSFTAVGNAASRAVMQRIGLVDTGERFEHPNVPAETGLREQCLYRIAHAQWLDREAQS